MLLHTPMYSRTFGQCPACSPSPSFPPTLPDLYLKKTYLLMSQNWQFWQFFGSWGCAQWSTLGIAFMNVPGWCWLMCTCCSNRSQSTYWLWSGSALVSDVLIHQSLSRCVLVPSSPFSWNWVQILSSLITQGSQENKSPFLNHLIRQAFKSPPPLVRGSV